MKTLLKLFVVLVVLVLTVSIGGYFYVTSSGFQKGLVEKNLPAGSSVEYVRVTFGDLKLSGLVVALEDGSTVAVGEVQTSFDPLAALLHDTIKLGALNVSGLMVELPSLQPFPTAVPQSQPTTDSDIYGSNSVDVAVEAPAIVEGQSSLESVYGLSEITWLLDVESLHLDGQLKDGQGNVYSITIDGDSIRPGQKTTVKFELESEFEQRIQADLKSLDVNSTLIFTQQEDGGFGQVHHESAHSGS